MEGVVVTEDRDTVTSKTFTKHFSRGSYKFECKLTPNSFFETQNA